MPILVGIAIPEILPRQTITPGLVLEVALKLAEVVLERLEGAGGDPGVLEVTLELLAGTIARVAPMLEL